MLKPMFSVAPDGQPWRITTLRNQNGMVVTFMDWGATWLSARIPMHDGSVREALLGCASPDDYLRQSAYLGAIIGRYANRIANATLQRGPIRLTANQGRHQLHGGAQGFDKKRWRILRQNSHEVYYQLTSLDGDQGFPGNLTATVHYHLDENNCLSISWQATTDKACPVLLTSHGYFNLDAQHSDARQHRLQLSASHYLPVDGDGIPAAPPTAVDGTGFDFRQPKTIARDFLKDDNQRVMNGYDHAFLLDNTAAEQPAARLCSADDRLHLTVDTSAPALQFYSGNALNGTPARHGGHYAAFQGMALESGFLPDSPNHPEWPQPDCWLMPHQTRKMLTRYTFIPRPPQQDEK